MGWRMFELSRVFIRERVEKARAMIFICIRAICVYTAVYDETGVFPIGTQGFDSISDMENNRSSAKAVKSRLLGSNL